MKDHTPLKILIPTTKFFMDTFEDLKSVTEICNLLKTSNSMADNNIVITLSNVLFCDDNMVVQ